MDSPCMESFDLGRYEDSVLWLCTRSSFPSVRLGRPRSWRLHLLLEPSDPQIETDFLLVTFFFTSCRRYLYPPSLDRDPFLYYLLHFSLFLGADTRPPRSPDRDSLITCRFSLFPKYIPSWLGSRRATVRDLIPHSFRY
ncbi:hypothetical protein B0H12DRAFT_727248 [Mycena haematopus]|nr:hypothetical protein B0H12DRAFT_727248 [Mycena haematopus]